MTFDVAIVGAGPAGATCAAFCAEAGLATLLLERAVFPREKVCGDCLNPACWPILDRLRVSERVLACAHSKLEEVEFIEIGGRALRYPLEASPWGELGIKRSLLDHVLLTRAAELGAEVQQGATVTRLERGWLIHTTKESYSARTLVAADGRNSSVARLLGLLPAARKDRIGVQTHFKAPADFGEKVVMRFLPNGYCGLASVGDGQLNLCLVSRGDQIGELKGWAGKQFTLRPEAPWQTITPLARAPVYPVHENLLLIGDVARVVEPFTGEGIYYALASGECAARAIVAGDFASFGKAHADLYRGRLWINELSKQAALHPRLASGALKLARLYPASLRFLTGKVMGEAARRPEPKASAQK